MNPCLWFSDQLKEFLVTFVNAIFMAPHPFKYIFLNDLFNVMCFKTSFKE